MNTQDPFASVRTKPSQNQQKNTQSNQAIEDDPFAEARIKKAEGFPLLYETGRHAARIGSRIAETIGGIPGDVSHLIQSGIFAGFEKLGGRKITEEEKKRARSRAPTSAELRNTASKLSKGLTEPQSEAEKIGDEIATTVTSLIGPLKFRRALGVATGAQLAKEGIKIAGAGEGSQEAGKLGTLFLLTLMNPGGAAKYASTQYEAANQLARGASVHAGQLESNLKSLMTDLEKGMTTSAKNAVIEPIKDFLPKITRGKIAVDELTAAKRDINTLMGDPALLKRERNLLKAVGGEVDKAIGVYERVNPSFKKVYRPANEIYGAVMQGNKISNFIKRHLGGKPALVAAITSAGEALAGYPEAILPTIAGSAAVMGGAKSVDFMMRVAKSPELQKFYIKAMAAAAAEDAAALRVYADKFEKALE